MFMSGSLWRIYFLGIFYPVAVDTSGKVTPGIVQKKALRGTNLMLQCPFPFDLDHSNVNVYWFRKDSETLLQDDSRKQFHIKKGGAYLHLLNVTVLDSGIYQCVAKDKDRTVGKGTFVQVVVYAVPVPLKIVSTPPERTSSASLRLQCRTAPFYPKDFNLTWHENGTEIVTGIETEQQAKTEGLFEVISYLEVTDPIERGTVYTCQVYHDSISIPANANYTVANDDYRSALPVHLIYRSTVGVLVIILLMMIIFNHVSSDNI
ncbi:natural cytotoxicity triggering receptor 3 ligand 1-like [Heptranchias perlo]|uniref:natural cytotoxicity triggering receptor 3 ligand 1-like n=1 Tax=Heptranchias perlo TaxID=212740 RepID=UPI00355A0220